jgi:hypothetical protein
VSNSSVLIREDRDAPLLARRGYKGREVLVHVFADGSSVPVMAGGADNPTAHPLAPPTVANNSITVDTLLQQPTRVTKFLLDLTLQRFIVDRLFASPGGVTGGAVVYDLLQGNDIYPDRDVEEIAPAATFPIVTSSRRAPQVASVKKYGGKFFITDEARDRNDQVTFRNEATRLGNALVRKLDTVGLAIVDAAITANGGASTFVGNDWSAAIPNGSSPTAPALTPGANFAQAQLLADQRELGVVFDTVLLNPVNMNELRLFYGSGLGQMLADNGFREAFATNRVPVGTAYYIASGQLGEMRIEKPLSTEQWREQNNQITWVQSDVRPVMYVTNPYAVLKATGL